MFVQNTGHSEPAPWDPECHSGHILTNAAGGQGHPWRNAEEHLTLGVIGHLCQLQPLSLSESVSRSVMSDSLRRHGLSPARLLCPWNSQGRNTGVGCLALLQGIFPTQGLNPGLPHCRWVLYFLRPGSPRILEWVAYCFSRGTYQHRDQTGVSCIAGGFFTR